MSERARGIDARGSGDVASGASRQVMSPTASGAFRLTGTPPATSVVIARLCVGAAALNAIVFGARPSTPSEMVPDRLTPHSWYV
jgi:hypothetical protein